jgi:ferredoxin-type protein NapG
MGLAVVSHRVCTAGQGCHACASKCPTGALSMDFDSQRLMVATERCVGCGLCEQVCRTVNDRVAIRVTPMRSLAQSL